MIPLYTYCHNRVHGERACQGYPDALVFSLSVITTVSGIMTVAEIDDRGYQRGDTWHFGGNVSRRLIRCDSW